MLASYVAEVPVGYMQTPIAGLVLMSVAWPNVYPNLTLEKARYLLLLQCETAAIRWRDDGADPTASLGAILNVGDSFLYTGVDPAALRFFSPGALLNITVWKAS